MRLVQGHPAWDVVETRRSHATYRLGALRWFGGGLACLALAAGLSAYAVHVLEGPGLGVFIVAAVILGVFGVVTGVGGLLRAQRFRRALRRAPWQHAELRVAGAHLRLVFAAADPAAALDAAEGKEGEDSAKGEDGSQSVDVTLMTTSRWRVRTVVGHRDGAVAVCRVEGAGFVLTAQGMNNLYGLRPLARQAGRYRP